MKKGQKTVLAGTVVALAVMGVSACGSETGAGSPEDVFGKYIEAINNQDFEAALGFVSNPGDVTPDSVVAFTHTVISEPTITSDAPKKGADSASVDFTIEGSPITVNFVKQDDSWALEKPELLEAYDFTASFDEQIAPLEQIADVEVRAVSGAMKPSGYFVNKLWEAWDVSVSLTGKYGVPDQVLDMSLEPAGDTFSAFLVNTESLDLGTLGESGVALAKEKMVVKTHVSKSEGMVNQYQRIASFDSCDVTPAEKRLAGPAGSFQFDCDVATLEATTIDGTPVMVNDGIQEVFERNGLKCARAAATENDRPTVLGWELIPTTATFAVANGEVEAIWAAEAEGQNALPIPTRWTQEAADAPCSAVSSKMVNTPEQGLVPLGTEDYSHRVTAGL